MWYLLIEGKLLTAMKRAKGTVKSYLNESNSPPWSFKSYINLESSPYFPIKVSFNSKTGVSISTAPCFLKTSVIILKALSLMAIWKGRKSLAPLTTFTFALRSPFGPPFSSLFFLFFFSLCFPLCSSLFCSWNFWASFSCFVSSFLVSI